ncbi:M1 family metallopeptidase [Nocardioides jensenii]|uniref:M1 family metallopeptidase n=1 Tax=Nocardioides jensenii TaxID=1843 RepID=UPI00082D783C|nr:M1 family metallopeptidase [Nocardioides jensenii]
MQPRTAGALVLAAALLAGCSDGEASDADSSPTTSRPADATRDEPGVRVPASVPKRWASAANETVEDSVYPQYGDPLVDALHYDLRLTWAPDQTTLTGVETLTFRATADASKVTLDLSDALTVSRVELDGKRAVASQHGDQLQVGARVVTDSVHTLRIRYAGTPRSGGSTFRGDIGVQLGPGNELGTSQEPYGAFTWYAVNDQPGDKAFYDFTLDVPAPWRGVANGELVRTTTTDGMTRTRWHLGSPASSYLTTFGFGDYRHKRLGRVDGVPVSVWSPRANGNEQAGLDYGDDALRWAVDRLGPYPFGSLGFLVTTGVEAGMETQTMITFGDVKIGEDFRAVIVHEVVHQWYGDLVTPADWSDVWMNEGMAYYLQKVWESENGGAPLNESMGSMFASAQESRRQSGPPGDYSPERFADINVYDSPALMWHALRSELGDETFWRLVREWPQQHRFASVTRDELVNWWSQESGQDLTSFFEDWLEDPELPSP